MSFSGKYIVKMFRLERLLVSEYYFEILWFFFMRVVWNQNQWYVLCIPWKIFEQVEIGSYTYFTFAWFSITMHEIDTAAEMYLEPFQTKIIYSF